MNIFWSCADIAVKVEKDPARFGYEYVNAYSDKSGRWVQGYCRKIKQHGRFGILSSPDPMAEEEIKEQKQRAESNREAHRVFRIMDKRAVKGPDERQL